MDPDKQAVHDFWNEEACGEGRALTGLSADDYRQHSRWRYANEPFILDFARFGDYAGKKVLEIGVGLGSDHQRFAEAGASLWGMDLTERAIEHTRRRLALEGLHSDLRVADAENLPFDDNFFDMVYSWGVLHHTPNTAKAVDEVYRVLRPGGDARIMLYHKYGIVGLCLWTRCGLLRLKPFTSLDEIYARYMESPGTQAFTADQARRMFSRFADVQVRILLGCGDLMAEHVGQRHQGRLLRIAKRIWPRGLVSRYLTHYGSVMTICAKKPS